MSLKEIWDVFFGKGIETLDPEYVNEQQSAEG